MMNALLAATLCSIVLMSAPVARAIYVEARKDGQKKMRRRHMS